MVNFHNSWREYAILFAVTSGSYGGAIFLTATPASAACTGGTPPYTVTAQASTVDLDTDCAGGSGIGGAVTVTGDVTTGFERAIVDGAGGPQDWAVTVNSKVEVNGGNASAAIEFHGPASLANNGRIASTVIGVHFLGQGSVTNTGDITGGASAGVIFGNQGSLTNSGIISGFAGAAFVGGASVINSGRITGEFSSGLALSDGGTITNTASGRIKGKLDPGITISGAAGSIDNAGEITGDDDDAVVFSEGGTIINRAGGTIEGKDSSRGILILGAAGSVDNAGEISGDDDDAVVFRAGGTITNRAGGTIEGIDDARGILIRGGTGSIDNAGMIIGGALAGTALQNGGTIINHAGGTIQSTSSGAGVLISGGSGSVDNAGNLQGDDDEGVELRQGGTIINRAGGRIEGEADEAIQISGGAGDITNAGTINSINGGHTVLFDSFNDRFEIQPGSVITNTTTAPTVVTPGIVQAAGGTDTLVFGGTGTSTFDISTVDGNNTDNGEQYLNFENFVKEDSSHLTLTGTNTEIGAFSVAGGKLTVNGTMGNTTFTVNGGTLNGSGLLGNLTVNAGSTLAPGNSIGTINAVSVVFGPASTYQVELNNGGFVAGTNNDLLAATGTVTLNGGTVHVTPDNGTDDGTTYTPGTYTIITAGGGVTGRFDAVTDDFAFLDFGLDYSNANRVDLISSLRTTGFCVAQMSANQCAAGNAVFSLGSGNLFTAVLNLSNADAPGSLGQLSGELHSSIATALLQDSRYSRDATSNRLRVAFDGVGADTATQAETHLSPDVVVWSQGVGSWGRWDRTGNAAPLDRRLGGLMLGADTQVLAHTRLGVMGGWSRSRFDLDMQASRGTGDSYTLGIYGGSALDAVTLDGGLAYTWHSLDTVRGIAFPGFADSVAASYDARTLQAWAELSHAINAGPVRVEPFASLAHVDLDVDRINETGGAAALTAASASASATFLTPGVRAQTGVDLDGMVATLRGSVAWQHAFGETPRGRMAFSSGGAPFAVSGVPLARDTLVVDTGLGVELGETSVASLTYGGQVGSGLTDHAVSLVFKVGF